MPNYETIFICRADLPDEKIQELTEKLKSIIVQSKGEINSFDNWGKKKLAYPIARQREGKYIYIDFTAPGDTVEEIEKFFRVTEGIIRFLTIKKSKKTAVSKLESLEERNGSKN